MNNILAKDEIEYYKTFGDLTDLTKYTEFTLWLSSDPRVIFQVAQGLIVHDSWTQRYGIQTRPEQRTVSATPSAADILSKVQELQSSDLSLSIPHRLEDRMLGCCRDFSVLAAALFKAKQIPARARCGFSLYLADPGFFEDHWICEYWNGQAWIMIDPQIDPFQQSVFHDYVMTHDNMPPDYKEMILKLDPMNVSSQHFINAGKAWKLYRSGKADPNKFGISSDPAEYGIVETYYGPWFIRGQLLRDFASLNKLEPEPFVERLDYGRDWNDWRLIVAKDEELSNEDWSLLDSVADLCAEPDGKLSAIRELFENNEDLQPLL